MISALELYEKYYTLNDNISHLLALQACINCNDYEKGTQIHSNFVALYNEYKY